MSGNITFEDGKTWTEAIDDNENMLETVFRNGMLVKERNLSEVRNILHGGKF